MDALLSAAGFVMVIGLIMVLAPASPPPPPALSDGRPSRLNRMLGLGWVLFFCGLLVVLLRSSERPLLRSTLNGLPGGAPGVALKGMAPVAGERQEPEVQDRVEHAEPGGLLDVPPFVCAHLRTRWRPEEDRPAERESRPARLVLLAISVGDDARAVHPGGKGPLADELERARPPAADVHPAKGPENQGSQDADQPIGEGPQVKRRAKRDLHLWNTFPQPAQQGTALPPTQACARGPCPRIAHAIRWMSQAPTAITG